MAEEKIKIKDIITQLDVAAKDVPRALRELGLPQRTISASVGPEDAERLRDYFISRKNEAVERTAVQPDVIVRRRRREPVAEVPVIEPSPERESQESAILPEEPAAPVEEVIPEPVMSVKARVKPPVMGARVISRPVAEKSEPETEIPSQVRPVAKKEPRQGKTLAEEIREAEAAQRAKAKAKAAEQKKRIERDATIIRKPETEQPAEADAAEVKAPSSTGESGREAEKQPHLSPIKAALDASAQAAKQEKLARRSALADASAKPSGSSRPAFTDRMEQTDSEESLQGQPRVKVISRPVPVVPARRPRPGAGGVQGERQTRTDGKPRQPVRSNAPRQVGYDEQFGRAGAQQFPPQGGEGKDGQSKKKRLKGRRTVDFQQGDFGRHPEDDENLRMNRGKNRRKAARPQTPTVVTQPVKAAKRKIRVEEAIRVADMAHQMGVKANEIIKVLFGLGVMATINQALDLDTATLVASEFGYEVEKSGFSEEDYLGHAEADTPESLRPRPPVVTIMGHVDHGKTSLLDAVRKSNVTSGEAGGITQHIGAYHVKTKRGDIVFLDTPGHEAFTAMRARGAQITDLVILVVAADDGVMEQTREAISHSRAADVPIVVAVNKMDKPGADPDRVLRELAELGLQPEDWGGDTIVSKVSAKTREGLDDLLELVALQAEILDLKANPDKAAKGRIVEARLDKGRGPIATVLIQEGTLHTGDNFVCGPFAGRVRAMANDQGKKVKEAGPSIPVEVQGFDGVPEAGEEFMVVADEKLARRISEARATRRRERDLAVGSKVTLETFLAQTDDDEAKTLNLVLKADVQGSLEAITEALQKLDTDKVKINVVHGGTGAISESDILLASASRAIIIGFNVRPAARIKDIAEKENVDIRFYDIIYKLVDDVKSAMAGMLAPVQKEVYLGQAEVRKVYNLPRVGAIAGSYVADGKIARNAGVRLLRDGVVAYTGKISSLKRFKEDAREVVKGNECGVGLENFNDIKVGDIIEAFETVEEAATL